MQVKNNNSGWFFSGDPILLETITPGVGNGFKGKPFLIGLDDEEVYRGAICPPGVVDVSDIVDAAVPQIEDPGSLETEAFKRIDNLEKYEFKVFSDSQFCGSFYALRGRTGDYALEEMSRRRSDIFADRFLNNSANRFLTTRTAGNIIRVKESEVYPLLFVFDGDPIEVNVIDIVSGYKRAYNLTQPGIYAFSVNGARYQFLNSNLVLPSALRIWFGDGFSCSILITEQEPAKERHIIKFRNSFGAFERVEMVSSVTETLENKEADSSYMEFNQATGRLSSRRANLIFNKTVEMKTGPKRPDEIRFILGMIASDEVYIEDLQERPVRVIPLVDDISFSLNPDAPESLKIRFKVCDGSPFETDLQTHDNIGLTASVFNDVFNENFK